MQPQQHNQTVRLTTVLLLPMLLLTACDSIGPPDEPVPQTARVNFDATVSWPSYGESIRAVGRQTFHYQSARVAGGEFDVSFRPEAIEAACTGMVSGDSYEQSWLGQSNEWEYAMKGPTGTERYISETILLTNSRTAEVAEGLVVTSAVITGTGEVSFEVRDVIPLP